MDILQETDTFHPLLLNIGYAIHHSDWNWTEVNIVKEILNITICTFTKTILPPPVSWKIWTSPLKFRPTHWIWS